MLFKLDSYLKSYHVSFCCRDSVSLIFHINHEVSGALPRHLSCICNYSSAFYRNHWDKFPSAKQKVICVCVCLCVCVFRKYVCWAEIIIDQVL